MGIGLGIPADTEKMVVAAVVGAEPDGAAADRGFETGDAILDSAAGLSPTLPRYARL